MLDENVVEVGNLWFKPIISEEVIKIRVKEMGMLLGKELIGKNPILIGVLNGCFIFMADLVRAMNIPCEIHVPFFTHFYYIILFSGKRYLYLKKQKQ